MSNKTPNKSHHGHQEFLEILMALVIKFMPYFPFIIQQQANFQFRYSKQHATPDKDTNDSADLHRCKYAGRLIMLGMRSQSRVPPIEVAFRCTIFCSSPFNPRPRFLEHSAEWTRRLYRSYRTLSRTSTTHTPRPGRDGIRTRNLLFLKLTLYQLRNLPGRFIMIKIYYPFL